MVGVRAWRGSFASESFENSPNDEALHVRFTLHSSTYWRKLLGATERQYFNELLKDRPVGDARAVTAEWMVRFSLGQQGSELFPDGLDEVRLECGHEA